MDGWTEDEGEEKKRREEDVGRKKNGEQWP